MRALPLPPKSLWKNYGQTETQYISSGQKDCAMVMDKLQRSGRILDFGCAAGRVMRHLPPSLEWFGCDVELPPIDWLIKNFPGTFVTTTTTPHLPFKDEFFDGIYGLSVFTHIEPHLQSMWLAELARVLQPNGRCFLTIQDENSLSKIRLRQNWLTQLVDEHVDQVEDIFSFRNEKGTVFTFHTRKYFLQLCRGFFNCVDYHKNACGPQSGVTLEPSH